MEWHPSWNDTALGNTKTLSVRYHDWISKETFELKHSIVILHFNNLLKKYAEIFEARYLKFK